MPIDITMPALSPTMEAGTLARWLVGVGDRVKSGDIIAEIESDKATMELEAADEGIIARLAVAEGADNVPVGQLIAVLATDGEEPASGAPVAPARATPAVEPATALSPAVRRLMAGNDLDPAAIAGTGKDGRLTKGDVLAALESGAAARATARPEPSAQQPGGKTNASALARRVAAASEIDLARVAGTGPGGRVMLADVLPARAPAAHSREAAPAPRPSGSAALAAPSYDAPAGVPLEAVRLSSMRRTIARRLTEAKQTVPHFYLSVDVRLDALLAQRRSLNAALDGQARLSVNDFLIKALALALIEVPDANVQFAGDQLYRFGRADISVAVAVPDGLVTPVVRSADTKRLRDISNEMTDLAARAREGKLQPQDYAGGTASLSNLGMYGVRKMIPVINPPQALIVGMGAGERRPVVDGDGVGVGTVASLAASFDHRAIDGAVGARFLAALKGLLEHPLTMLG